MERGAVHVRLEEIREFLAFLLGAQQPRHEVHADENAVEGVTLEVLLEASVAGRNKDIIKQQLLRRSSFTCNPRAAAATALPRTDRDCAAATAPASRTCAYDSVARA